ncbi:MAG: ribonuclease J [Holosporaceae bacterium]|jgi:ribonuclease J|nr:ribonuclease J [Holosporaceae bacterium]
MSNKNEKIKGLSFVPIGGCTSVGMNLYVYIYGDQWILVDMGMGFDGNFGRELLVPSPDVLIKNKAKIKALFITHSHEDHIGAIPYLWPMLECPVYARSFAAEMIREKLAQFDLDKKVPIIRVSLHNKVTVGDFAVEFISVAHSTPESSALAITTPAGVVFHSGDWRIDDDPVLGEKTDEEKIKEYGKKGVTALVCDSTNVFRNTKYGSERDVRKNLIELVQRHKNNRIMITCFASNLARLESCYCAAKESGRELIIVGRSLKKIERIAKASGYFAKIPAFLDERKANTIPPSKALLVCTGSQGELNSALSKISRGQHKAVQLQKNDLVIFSSRIIPGNEKSVLEIQNALTENSVDIITDIDYEIHASGHPSRAELEHLYSLIKPKVLVPIHGERIHLHKHAEIAREYGIAEALVVRDGDVVNLSEPKAAVVDTFAIGTLAVDGQRLIPLNGVVYAQRETLASGGVVSVAIRYSKGAVKLQDMACLGVFEESEREECEDLKNDVASEIKLSLEGFLKGKSSDREKIRSLSEKLIKTAFMNARGKKPTVIVHVVE